MLPPRCCVINDPKPDTIPESLQDRFHVIGWFAAGLTAVRRDVQRRQPAGVTPVFDPDVFRARFLLLRRPDRLDDAQRSQLEAIFEAHPRLRDAWEALGELHGLYLADDKAGALAALDRFTDLYQTGDLPEFYKIVNTLLAAMPRILAWHTAGRKPPPTQQRPHRRHQQPPPSPTPHRPRLHQPPQLRRPRTPRDMMHPTDTNRPKFHPRFREASRIGPPSAQCCARRVSARARRGRADTHAGQAPKPPTLRRFPHRQPRYRRSELRRRAWPWQPVRRRPCRAQFP